jgi:hypothetical protein
VSGPASTGDGGKKVPTADEKMSPKEKDALADQIEDFEGPDRREKRGTEHPEQDEPGVARS